MTHTAGNMFGHRPPLPPQPRQRDYSADEECAVDALLLLSISCGGLCLQRQPTPPAKPAVYVCDLCGATFPSHQALGGHKTCHRPKQPAAKSSGEKSRYYVCNICGALFASGQAVGGHHRKHYRERESRKSQSSSGSSGDVVTIVQEDHPVRRGLDFDLNLPYPFAD
ncbi:C2H2 type zinc finger transcription factor family [Striga hermonthica]|uniref:C2H2 type zinc finger transcription factor family n=1 Tax=Striga hermonthica TaxID=68872 RepID=A0A9N7NJC2_STRHE|nr:C2H2 type zinc finger transcription factor family [Striga hermonthica]